MTLRAAVIMFSGFTQHLNQQHGTARLFGRLRHRFAGSDMAVEVYPWDDSEVEERARYFRDELVSDGLCCLYGYSRGWEAMERFCGAFGRRVAWIGANDPCPVQALGLANALNWISGGAWCDAVDLPGNVIAADAWRQTKDRPRGRWVRVVTPGQQIAQHTIGGPDGPGHSDMDELPQIHDMVERQLANLLTTRTRRR